MHARYPPSLVWRRTRRQAASLGERGSATSTPRRKPEERTAKDAKGGKGAKRRARAREAGGFPPLRVSVSSWGTLVGLGCGFLALRSQLVAQPGRGQAVGVLVPALTGVRGDPLQRAARMEAALREQLLHEREVLDLAALLAPALALPGGRPLLDRVHAQAAVRVHDHLGVVGQEPEGLDQRRELHAVVRRLRVVPVTRLAHFARLDPHHAPASRA